MPDVINKEENLGALDDLGKIGNNSQNPLDFAYKLEDFELGLDAAKLAKQQEGKNEKLSETMTPGELLKAVQRDMNMKSKYDNER